jgi:hypothetical protein
MRGSNSKGSTPQFKADGTLGRNYNTQMPFTIFYAWQMDRPTKLNRWFIQSALKAAIKQLKKEFSADVADVKLEPARAIEKKEEQADPEPDPADEQIILQVGAVGVGGAQLIAETILHRIAQCDVFVADLSFVGEVKTADGRDKLLPNPNVLIESGAAARTGQGWDRVVLVLNTAFGAVDQLPFDLKHRVCHIKYELSDPNDPDRTNKKIQLTKDLVSQIRQIYQVEKSRQQTAHEQTTANATSEGLLRANKIRDDFERSLAENRFYNFKAQCCILAVSLTPLHPKTTELNLGRIDESALRGYIQPLGNFDGHVRHRMKSITCETDSGVPVSLVELTSAGSILACYNLKYGQDNVTMRVPHVKQIDPSKPYILSMENYQSQLISGVPRFLKGLVKLDIVGPWVFSLSLLKARNCQMVLIDRIERPQSDTLCELDDIRTESLILPSDLNLKDNEAVTMAMSQSLRQLWRACGYSTFPIYRPDGVIDWAR